MDLIFTLGSNFFLWYDVLNPTKNVIRLTQNPSNDFYLSLNKNDINKTKFFKIGDDYYFLTMHNSYPAQICLCKYNISTLKIDLIDYQSIGSSAGDVAYQLDFIMDKNNEYVFVVTKQKDELSTSNPDKDYLYSYKINYDSLVFVDKIQIDSGLLARNICISDTNEKILLTYDAYFKPVFQIRHDGSGNMSLDTYYKDTDTRSSFISNVYDDSVIGTDFLKDPMYEFGKWTNMTAIVPYGKTDGVFGYGVLKLFNIEIVDETPSIVSEWISGINIVPVDNPTSYNHFANQNVIYTRKTPNITDIYSFNGYYNQEPSNNICTRYYHNSKTFENFYDVMDIKPQFMSGNTDPDTGYASVSIGTNDGKYICLGRSKCTVDTSTYDENLIIYEVSENIDGEPKLKQKNILTNYDIRTTAGYTSGSVAFDVVSFLEEIVYPSRKTQSCLV